MGNIASVKQSKPMPFSFDAENISVEAFVDHVDDLSKQYGLYGQVVERRPYPASEIKEKYVYFGIEPFSVDVDIAQLSVLPERNTNVFFPKRFAIKLDDENKKNTMFLLQSAIDYCRDAEFVKNIYYEFKAPIPDRILGSELSRLVELSKMFNNKDLGIDGKLLYVKSLSRFFKRERSKNPLLRKWIAYKRSDRFLYGNKSIFAHLRALFNKKKNIAYDSLQENCTSTSHAVLPAHRVKDFVKYMDENYPDISYSIGPKTITDYGVLNDKQNAAIIAYNGVNPYGKTVSYEQFCNIVDEKFQTKGFSAIKDLNPSRWEMRALTFSASDEPFIAKAFNNINFRFAKKETLQYIQDRADYRGKDVAVAIPADDMLNFVSLATSSGLHYFFDSIGYYGVPNLDTVYVAYNENDQKLVDKILTRMVRDRVNNGHYVTRVQAPHPSKLNQRIQAAQSRSGVSKCSQKTPARER